MSDFFRQAKDKLTGDTNVANDHLKKLSSKYLHDEADAEEKKAKNNEAYSKLIGAGQKHSTATTIDKEQNSSSSK